jgi:hypothetical protein
MTGMHYTLMACRSGLMRVGMGPDLAPWRSKADKGALPDQPSEGVRVTINFFEMWGFGDKWGGVALMKVPVILEV